MTENIKIAQKYLNSRPKQGNVSYALVGDEFISGTLGAYCYGDMRINASKDYKPDEKYDGVPLCPQGYRIPGQDQYLVIMLNMDNPRYFRIPVDTLELKCYWKIVKQYLSFFEQALIPDTMASRIKNGIVIDLSKITMSGVGVLAVGYRNLYEKKNWKTIEQLLKMGAPFDKAFHLAQCILYDENSEAWLGNSDTHVILDGWNYLFTSKTFLEFVLDSPLLSPQYLYEGVSFRDTNTPWSVLQDMFDAYRPSTYKRYGDLMSVESRPKNYLKISDLLGLSTRHGEGWERWDGHTMAQMEEFLSKHNGFNNE